jgi:hypothetical protein
MIFFQAIVGFIVLTIILLVVLQEIYEILWKKEFVIDGRRIKVKDNKLRSASWLITYFFALFLISYMLFQLCKEILGS